MRSDDLDLDSAIFMRETERQKNLAEQRTKRIQAACIAAPICVFLIAAFALWAYTVHVPDPSQIKPGTKVDCVVQEESR